MTVHTASDTLVVAELSAGEGSGRDELQGLIYSVLDSRGLQRWKSMELEIFQGADVKLVMAVPVKLLIPKFLLDALAHEVDT